MSNILLLGDTSIEKFPKNYIENESHRVINAGIKNIEIAKYSMFIPRILEKTKNIDYVVLQLGMTDIININYNKDNRKYIDILIEQIKKIIYIISNKNINLIVLPLLPTRNEKLNNQIKEYNYALAKLCYEGVIEFLDIYDMFLDEENLLKIESTNKGIKLNKSGYAIVANQINEYINSFEKNYSQK